MKSIIQQIRNAKSMDQIEKIAEDHTQDLANISDKEYDVIVVEICIAEEKFKIINAAIFN